ncbi:MAG: phosphate transport system protein [Methanolobus sp.]|jgi:phosphate transport system protein|uniref:phosphate signaling complex protein PhoU n=1 Tax=Methanolobus sp. TaxID=1874737 RepID=UPI0024AC2DC7|nr:phosphate signaling complex protein PhoU [Methanolobus sp.]MDI3486482.1 phosphate transport system protein [Methanolobus sp.]MDK2832321.1 phosphate transport system protein [Methanolobus sp.]MDK2939917.1 phosphate transport system protein [Methanolobus sp.]
MARDQFQQNLETLKGFVSEMGKLSHEAIVNSIRVLESQDSELAEKIRNDDEIIDDFELKIEKCSTQLIARQNPTAGDMRLIISCFKIAIDLERMSDLAVDVSNIANCMEKKNTDTIDDILKMADICEEMLQQAISAFETLDQELAKSTALKDDELDKLFYATHNKLIEMMVEDNSLINCASHLLLVLRYLERMGDHACNICESIVYMTEGKRVNLN